MDTSSSMDWGLAIYYDSSEASNETYQRENEGMSKKRIEIRVRHYLGIKTKSAVALLELEIKLTQ